MPNIAFYKLVSLTVRVFTRPFYNYIKSYYLWNFSRVNWWGNRKFESLGRTKLRWEVWLNSRLLLHNSHLAQKAPTHSRSVSEAVAREKGIEFFWDLMFYFTVLSVGIYEATKNWWIGQNKIRIEDRLVTDIETRLADTYSRVYEIRAQREEVVSQLDSKLEALKTTLGNVIQEVEKANDAEHRATESAIEVQHCQIRIQERIKRLIL